MKKSRKPQKSTKKIKKSNFEEKLEQLVNEYRNEKEYLDNLVEGSIEFNQQKIKCDSLYAKAERFINKQS
ncbi:MULTISPECIES: hypothetical protein [Pseudoalteromonas]|uniref:hypothetical protein n=1 Tax=unclassified Pseudoalteromonas TaxID=194690 RepID=UPI000CF6548C|nr:MULTISPECIES: hypothetical protein [unclassified Pseudoalteromonas]MBN4057758.1 hypothetical protein [Pseudoalteromonas haloplanktis]TMO28646.1 hypothetical protein CWC28_08445 [Pseudoalteromonas sp. S4492]